MAKSSAQRSREWNARNPGRSAAASKNWRANNPEKSAAANKRWKDANPEKRAAYQLRADRKRHAAHPEKNRARSLLNYHVNAGNVLREPCEVCGSEDVQAHHDDYDKPLEVRWLCITHHREEHA